MGTLFQLVAASPIIAAFLVLIIGLFVGFLAANLATPVHNDDDDF
ncbi:hypothetical protein [Sphingobacterium mizutaii]|nr:hypothetical protein [Sphingobacterium mizutaii]